ncbi:MAG: aminotransferase class I/II-fold pyridoxal phosphate-dependent enzyme [Bryobacterales bacterium]|nr:aminotransferase class I/II-fold pyridoxal phosphate-dependent enzyme [Bryobacterales bacterium]
MKQQTIAIHACARAAGESERFAPSAPPLETAASFHYRSAADLTAVANAEIEGFVYQRYGNPSADALQRQMAALDHASSALACSSGMAAMHIGLLTALRGRPKTILAANVLFGQTFQLLQLMEQQGFTARFADSSDLAGFEAALDRAETGCILVETVSNPLLRVTPIGEIARMAAKRGIPVLVDATFAPPVMNRPLEWGATVVVHSATKYLAGHADVLGGMVACGEAEAEYMQELGRHFGANLGPFQCFLTARGVKTLPMRMEEHCRNAMIVAKALERHPRVGAVYYAGLASHPDRALAEQLFDRDTEGALMCGGMVSFEVQDANQARTFRFLDALRLVVRTLSLGDVHSLVTHPATTTHRNLGEKRRQRLGIPDSLVRFSVGIEDPDDIVADVVQALESS